MTTGIIGGTGLQKLSVGCEVEQIQSETPFGEVSAPLITMAIHNQKAFLLFRHGVNHHLAPHLINYRANISALAQVGVKNIVAVHAVGSLNKRMPPRALVIPDQIIDYTWGREHSFSDGVEGTLQHIDFTEPFSKSLRQALMHAAKRSDVVVIEGGTYGCVQGPRLETAAEIRRMGQDGCDLVGMTAMPEASLARELGLSYVSLSLVVNWAAGISEALIDMAEIKRVVEQGNLDINAIFDAFFHDYSSIS